MKCIICGKNNEKSVCSDCENKKRCKECNVLKTDFYKYKNGKLYSTCIECFNKKVKCEFCNKEVNKTYLSKHLKRCNINHDNNKEIINHSENHDNNNYTNNDNDNENQIDDDNNQNDNNQIDDANENYNNQTDDNNNQIDNNCNRTLIVGPSFCGKTHLLLNKLRLIRLEDPEKQIRIITRSPEQYEDVELYIQGIEVEENVGDLEEYRGCCVVFDDMLDSNQKLIDPFFTREDTNLVMFKIYVRVILMRQKRQLETIQI